MNNREWCSTKAQCPFYKAQERQAIVCAGGTVGRNLRLTFSRAPDRSSYGREFCEAEYRSCVYYGTHGEETE